MDNTEDSGSSAGGSIPSEGAKYRLSNLVSITRFFYLSASAQASSRGVSWDGHIPRGIRSGKFNSLEMREYY